MSLSIRELMSNFFNNVWSAISLLAWSDWVTLIILIVFVVRGFVQGLAKEVISFIFVIFAIVIAWLYYETFAKTKTSSWNPEPTTGHPAQRVFTAAGGFD